MSIDEKKPPDLLTYQGAPPVPSKKPWSMTRKYSVLCGLLLLAACVCGYLEMNTAVGFLIAFAFLSLMVAGFGPPIYDMFHGHEQTEEEYEAEYAQRDHRKQELLALAARIYARAPLGTWQIEDVTYWVRGDPILHERRTLTFTTDGRGKYAWFKAGDYPVSLETIFEFRATEDSQQIEIRLLSPSLEGWHAVGYDFEIGRDHMGELELFIVLGASIPLPPDLGEYWPFRGTFMRSAV